jgi:N-acetylglucosamine malate deacetylase 1
MSEAQKLMVIAPHPDDEVLGAGGTIARFAAAAGEVTVLTICVHSPPMHSAEHRDRTLSEAKLAHEALGVSHSVFIDHPAVNLTQSLPGEIYGRCATELERCRPDLLLIPHADLHPDHRAVFELGMFLGRPLGAGRALRMLACYETITETHWNAPGIHPSFAPTWFVDIERSLATKLKAASCYASQIYPYPEPRSLEAIEGLARFRGSQSGVGAAEAFQVIRMAQPPESR